MSGSKCLFVAQDSQEKVLHNFMVVLSITVWQETGSKHYDGIHSVAIVAWNHNKGKKNIRQKNKVVKANVSAFLC